MSYTPEPAPAEGEWVRDPDGFAIRWRQAHAKLVRAAIGSWVGWPTDMHIHMRDEQAGAPQPSSGTGKEMRAQAAALLWELRHKARATPLLYRGARRPPAEIDSWSESRAHAEKWAKKSGGQVFELPAGTAKGLRFKDYGIDPFGEAHWIVETAAPSWVREARENPVAAREISSAAFVCMGRQVSFDLDNGGQIDAHARDGMLYDQSGRIWPSNSLLVTRFDQGSQETDDGLDYFGEDAIVYRGHVELPPKSLDSWQEIGVVTQVFYDRAGTKHPGYYKHEFNKPRGMQKLVALFKKRVAEGDCILYELGGCYRLELPQGCIIDDRGIVLP